MDIIQVFNLNKTFKTPKKSFTAVKDVSFNVKKGEIFGFLGPNGAGKTTTINMLCTLLRPTKGKAFLNGYNIVKEPHSVRQSIGLVFQDSSLDDKLTAKENLEFHTMIYNVPKHISKKRIKEMLVVVELEHRENDLVGNFSGGMKRRLEIARGLLHYPKVLFLDEPTLGLDPQTRNHVWDYVDMMRRKEDITIFLTTHYMDEAENCDRIAIIDNGEIIVLDTPDNLKKDVRGDIICLSTANNKKAREIIELRYCLKVRDDSKGIYFEIEQGERFLPNFIKEANFDIRQISLSRPTLDDVFLKLTGKNIREEHADGLDLMRAHIKMKRR
ncbi:MAG: ATP-binding cassette domain-containing protein [Nitrospirota bacterium]